MSLVPRDNQRLLEAAEGLGVPLPFATALRDRIAAGIARGDAALDLAAIALGARRDAGLEAWSE